MRLEREVEKKKGLENKLGEKEGGGGKVVVVMKEGVGKKRSEAGKGGGVGIEGLKDVGGKWRVKGVGLKGVEGGVARKGRRGWGWKGWD